MSYILDKFGDFISWGMDDRWPVSMVKQGISWTTLIAVITSPFVYMAIENIDENSKLLADLDARETHIFRSLYDCVSNGYEIESCKKSYNNAVTLSKASGLAISFNDKQACFSKHGDCKKEEQQVAGCMNAGNVPVCSTQTQITYTPFIRGWQAAAGNIHKAAPLYGSPDPRILIRSDNKILQLAR